MDEEKNVPAPEETPVQDNSSQDAKAASGASNDSAAALESGQAADNIAEGSNEMPDISAGVDPVPEASGGAVAVDEAPKSEGAPAGGASPQGDNPDFSEDEMAAMTDEEKAMLMSMDDVPEDSSSGGSNGLLSQEDLDAAMAQAKDSNTSGSGGLFDSASIPQEEESGRRQQKAQQTSVSRAEFQQLSPGEGGGKSRNIDLLMDVDLPVSIELGRTRMNISDILSLGPGSVVELDKLVGEPVDLLVNQKTVARGEVVVVEENFGLRITELVSAEERIRNLE